MVRSWALLGVFLALLAGPSSALRSDVLRHKAANERLATVNANANTNSIGSAVAEQTDMSKNPVRKVVTLLQNLAKKIEKEAETEKDLYEKFMCYCKNSGGELAKSMADSDAKIPALQTDIEASESQVAQFKLELKKHQVDMSDVKSAKAEATSLRDKEHAEFSKEADEAKGYVKALDKAIPSVEQGMAGGALLQSSSTSVLLQHAIASDRIDLTDDDRQVVTAFLSGTVAESFGYVPKGSEVVGILKDMRADYAKYLGQLEDEEGQAAKTYEELMAAKTKEEKTLASSIEKKTARIGELSVSIVSMKDDLTDTEAALVEDTKMSKTIATDCETKQKEMELRVATRGEELTAVFDTIKILNDDDALELFKKTLPAASADFLQLRAGEQQVKQHALKLLQKAGNVGSQLHGPNVQFLEQALMGGKADFSKVIKMIDDMIKILAEEQMDDDHKGEYCKKTLDFAEEKLKELSGTESDLETSIEDSKATLAQLQEDLKVLHEGISDLDKSVRDSTEQRKEENEEYTELMSSNTAAKELLEFAKNRLNKFYNPKLYKTPPKADLQQVDATSFLEVYSVKSSTHEDPPPVPAGDYKKKTEESGGVIAMIDLLVKDLDKEMTEAEQQEKDAQLAYEGLMTESAQKRSADTKLVAVKEASKADTEELLVKSDGELTSTQKELMATKQYEGQLHGECDWLLKYYDLRKQARSEESDNLKMAKATLSGADFSLLQQNNLLRR